MRILVVNDDGIRSEGIAALVRAVRPLGEILVAAPMHQQTAKGHGMNFDRELRVKPWTFADGTEAYAIDGTPRDCVYVALDVLMEGRRPDIVLSGINEGSNISNACVASGTVGAATGSFLEGIPSIAFSLDFGERYDYDLASDDIRRIAKWFVEQPFRHDFVLNVNIPNRSDGLIRGITVADYGGRQLFDSYFAISRRDKDEFYVRLQDGSIKFAMNAEDIEHDIYALKQGYIVLTPLDDDVVRKESLSELREAVGKAALR